MSNIIFEDILEKVKRNGFYIYPNYFDQKVVDQVKAEYFRVMDSLNVKPAGVKLKPADLVNRPWRKLAVGSRNGAGEPYSQVLQTTYFSQNDAARPALSHVFSRLIEFRNGITGMALDYGSDLSKDHFWNACRVHHYPQGGGHMAPHRDTGFPAILKNFQIPFIQIMLTLSSRGDSFEQGGGYIQRDGNKVFLENETNEGSLVVFDGNTLHGVDDIDPDGLLNFNSHLGRLALFVNLYRNPSI